MSLAPKVEMGRFVVERRFEVLKLVEKEQGEGIESNVLSVRELGFSWPLLSQLAHLDKLEAASVNEHSMVMGG